MMNIRTIGLRIIMKGTYVHSLYIKTKNDQPDISNICDFQ